MMNMMDYIQNAIEKKSCEVLFTPENTPRVRVGREWQNLSDESLSAAQTKELLCSLLTPVEKQLLFEVGSVQGLVESESQQLRFHVQLTQAGVIGSVRWLDLQLMSPSFWNFPDFVFESILRGGGLHVLSGLKDGSLEASVMAIIQTAAQKKAKHIVWLSEEKLPIVSSSHAVISYITNGNVPDSADIVILNESHGYEKALKLSEQGYTVIFLTTATSVVLALQKIIDHLAGDMTSRLRRLAANLKLAIGVKLVNGIQQLNLGAYELLLVTPDIERILDQGRFAMLENLMSETSEKSGMRTMNQSLLSFMLKRKIDFKTGFEQSPQPEVLDEMLKRIGF